MHGSEDKSCVCDDAMNVTRSIVPIDSQRFNGSIGFILGRKKLHDSSKVVRLSRRFAN